jgi:hypothetical protein
MVELKDDQRLRNNEGILIILNSDVELCFEYDIMKAQRLILYGCHLFMSNKCLIIYITPVKLFGWEFGLHSYSSYCSILE